MDATETDADDPLAGAYARGLACERAGDHDGAEAAWRECLALDPEDHGGAAVRLAVLGRAAAPERASPAYVATLFDQHADSFEMTLVHSLGYAIPEVMARRLGELGLGPFGRVLDLGCGTGLVGEALEEVAGRIDGVDLSEGMLDVAAEKEVYGGLFVGDAVAFLGTTDEAPYDLIAAADVLPYLGDVEPLLDGLARLTAPGGTVAFSTETLPEAAFAGRPWAVGPKQRFAHSEPALRRALEARGFRVVAADPVVVRHEVGEPVPGHLFVALREG